ncbi:MAG: outer membrane protein assembly factor BamD [Verrucomicrobia bacterium]|nr:outer membrane protein assembly factor BamD [Verrucomicrobiota bacterium]
MDKMLVFLAVLCAPLFAHASYTFKNGKLIKSEEVATLSVQEHYSAMMDAYQTRDFEETVAQALVVIRNFPATPFASEAYYYLGMGYFELGELEYANRFLGTYLKKQSTPKFFEEAIECKFKIGEKYHHGAKRHILGWEAMPKWVPAREEAVSIYDEVITALPHHDLAAKALFGKAELLLKDEEYKSSIETYQTLIRRFPKHALAPESYIGIGHVYLVQSKNEYPDQDFLDLSEINLRKFRQDFPGEERVAVAEEMLQEMREIFASDLYDTARFYERTHKPHAAEIYYTRILAKYPQTSVAENATRRMGQLRYQKPATSIQEVEPVRASPLPTNDSSPLLDLPVAEGLLVEATPGDSRD